MVRLLAPAILIALLTLGCDVSDPMAPVVPYGADTATSLAMPSFFPIPPTLDTATGFEHIDFPRWPYTDRRADLLPVSRHYDTDSRYTGVTGRRTGTCRVIPVHGYRFGRDPSGAPIEGDTLRLDLWLTTRCAQGGGNYDELRLLWDMRSPRLPIVSRATVTVTKPGTDYYDERRVIFSRSLLALYDDPSAHCIDRPDRWQLSTSQVIPIPLLWTCREGDPSPIGDTIRLSITFEPPVTDTGYACLPNPSLLVAELTDTRNDITTTAPFFFGNCFP
jgi:hypothetical protein